MTQLGDVLSKAMERRNNDINLFMGKYQNGKEVRLMDLDQTELQKCYDHCTDMLGNTSNYNPGKYVIKQNIKHTYENCNVELFLRYLLHESNHFRTHKELLDYINAHKETGEVTNQSYVTSLFTNVLPVFEKVTVDKLMNACFDKLDVLNNKMISEKFILSQGIWLTEAEKEDLSQNSKLTNYIEMVKERLMLKPDMKIRINPNGLNFQEFRALIRLENLPKISSLSTLVLSLLRDKILLLLENELDYHIKKWNSLKEKVERVAEYKNIKLVCKTY